MVVPEVILEEHVQDTHSSRFHVTIVENHKDLEAKEVKEAKVVKEVMTLTVMTLTENDQRENQREKDQRDQAPKTEINTTSAHPAVAGPAVAVPTLTVPALMVLTLMVAAVDPKRSLTERNQRKVAKEVKVVKERKTQTQTQMTTILHQAFPVFLVLLEHLVLVLLLAAASLLMELEARNPRSPRSLPTVDQMIALTMGTQIQTLIQM
jgi:hypothetical protein